MARRSPANVCQTLVLMGPGPGRRAWGVRAVLQTACVVKQAQGVAGAGGRQAGSMRRSGRSLMCAPVQAAGAHGSAAARGGHAAGAAGVGARAGAPGRLCQPGAARGLPCSIRALARCSPGRSLPSPECVLAAPAAVACWRRAVRQRRAAADWPGSRAPAERRARTLPYPALTAGRAAQVVLHPALEPPRVAVAAWAWVGVLLALSGLAVLLRVTTSDPGLLPRGGPAAGAHVPQARAPPPARSVALRMLLRGSARGSAPARARAPRLHGLVEGRPARCWQVARRPPAQSAAGYLPPDLILCGLVWLGVDVCSRT